MHSIFFFYLWLMKRYRISARHFRQNPHFPKGPFAISFEFLFTVWRFWRLIAISAILPMRAFLDISPSLERGQTSREKYTRQKLIDARSPNLLTISYYQRIIFIPIRSQSHAILRLTAGTPNSLINNDLYLLAVFLVWYTQWCGLY